MEQALNPYSIKLKWGVGYQNIKTLARESYDFGYVQ